MLRITNDPVTTESIYHQEVIRKRDENVRVRCCIVKITLLYSCMYLMISNPMETKILISRIYFKIFSRYRAITTIWPHFQQEYNNIYF